MNKINWIEVTPNILSKDCFWKMNEKNDELHTKDLLVGLAENFSLKPAKKTETVIAAKTNINLRVIDFGTAQNLSILLRGWHKKSSYEQINKHILD